MFSYSIKTRYAETGQDGIIHHSSYIIYYEAARLEYLSTFGFDINEMEKNSILCPVVSIDAKYIRPLYSLETITIRVKVFSCSKVRFQILHEIYRGEEKVASALSSHCFINKAFKPIPIPAKLAYHFQEDLKKNT